MFARLVTIVLLVLPSIAVPTDGYSTSDSTAPSCSSGEVMCCDDATKAGPASAGSILGTLLGASLGSLTVPLSVKCIPVTGIGADGESCAAQTACCEHNNINGLVSVACTPINVNV
ncbi:hypothetical protein C0995_000926 [Termitomyces sp. Mi166|nr:hypothetical protein C0995_000926 [Termitomyces sp. Mi166\